MTASSKIVGARDTGTKESCGLSGVMKRRERRQTDRGQTDDRQMTDRRVILREVIPALPWLGCQSPLLSSHGSQATISVTVLAWKPSVFLEFTSSSELASGFVLFPKMP